MRKRGIATLIAYVLLVALALMLSGFIYGWLKFTTSIIDGDDDVLACPENVNVIVRSDICTPGPDGNISVTVQNRGLFAIDGFVLRVSDEESAEFGDYILNDTGVPLEPEEKFTGTFSFSGTGLTEVRLVEIQAFLISEEKLLCGGYALQKLACEATPADVQEYIEENTGGGGSGSSDPDPDGCIDYEICGDNVDNDCNDESGYDNSDGLHGDAFCPVFFTAITVSDDSPSAGSTVDLSCGTNFGGVNSVRGTISSMDCSYLSCSGENVFLECTNGSDVHAVTLSSEVSVCGIVDLESLIENNTDMLECSYETCSGSVAEFSCDIDGYLFNASASGVDCASADFNSISDLFGVPCVNPVWAGNVVTFECNVGTEGLKAVGCSVDELSSYWVGGGLVNTFKVKPFCVDADGDGYTDEACGGTDCDDSPGADNIYPGAPEICGDTVDQNCSGGDFECVCYDCDDCGTFLDFFCDRSECLDCGGECYFVENVFPIPNTCESCSGCTNCDTWFSWELCLGWE